jgi:hypothetical protein
MSKLTSYGHNELAMASIRVAKRDGAKVWFAYRADSKAEQDSGWVFHGPNEGDEYCSNPSNFIIVPVSSMLVLNPGLEQIIEKPRWTCWERYSDKGPWFEVPDFFKGKKPQ